MRRGKDHDLVARGASLTNYDVVILFMNIVILIIIVIFSNIK